MQVEGHLNVSYLKDEPSITDDFEIRRTSDSGHVHSSFPVNDSQDCSFISCLPSPPEEESLEPRRRRTSSSYEPGAGLNLPLAVIVSLKTYAQRLERACGRYVCIAAMNSCLESFGHFEDFHSHLCSSHSYCKRYRCPYCGLSVPTETIKVHIDQHFEAVNQSGRYPCPFCFRSINCMRRRDLAAHIDQHHKDSMLKYPHCRMCFSFFADVNDYCNHVERYSFDLFHCPEEKCLVKSRDKMLVVNHYLRIHEHSQRLAIHFRSSRHSSCAIDVGQQLEVYRPLPVNRRADNFSCSGAPQEQRIPIIVLECPVCRYHETKSYHKFFLHLSRCSHYSDGAEVELCAEESELSLHVYSCSSCGAVATKKPTIQVHLRSGRCSGINARLLSEVVSVERLGVTTTRRRPRVMLPPVSIPPQASPSLRSNVDSPNTDGVSVSTEDTIACKEEPASLETLLGWGRINLNVAHLLTNPEILISSVSYASLTQMTADVSNMAIAVYSSASGNVFVCQTCSQHVPVHTQSESGQHFGRHMVEHYEFTPSIRELCVQAIKVVIRYVDGQTETIPRDPSIPMVIKDEPLIPQSSPSHASEKNLSRKSTSGGRSQGRSSSSQPLIPLRVSAAVLDQVLKMLPNAADAVELRQCMKRYSNTKVSFASERFRCLECSDVQLTSFHDIRRHVIRKHCLAQESLMVYCTLLVRQQLPGSYELIPDDLQLKILDMPTVIQTQINYRITHFIRQRKTASKEFPSMTEIRRIVDNLCDKNTVSGPRSLSDTSSSDKGSPAGINAAQSKRKFVSGAIPGKLTPSETLSAASTGDDNDEDDIDLDREADVEDRLSVDNSSLPASEKKDSDIRHAVITFDRTKFEKLSSVFQMDGSAQDGVKRKMELVKSARISCQQVQENRVRYKCDCGKYEEVVQNMLVTDGPRRHALRDHVRISKVHWSVCLQCTTLVFYETKTPPEEPSGGQKRVSEYEVQVEPKRSRTDFKEGEESSLLVCGFKMRPMDKTKPLAHVESMETAAAMTRGYSGFAVTCVQWEQLVDSKRQFQTDFNAEELRLRAARVPEYRVYTLQGERHRSYVCSACGFHSDYSSRDVRRHLLVQHLGINVELVTSILNFSETKSFAMERHSDSYELLCPEVRPEGGPEVTEAASKKNQKRKRSTGTDQSSSGSTNLMANLSDFIDSIVRTQSGSEAEASSSENLSTSDAGHGGSSTRKKLRPSLPAFARRTLKNRVTERNKVEEKPVTSTESDPNAKSASIAVESNDQPSKGPEVTESISPEAALTDLRFQPCVKVARLSAREIELASPEKSTSSTRLQKLFMFKVNRTGASSVFRCSECDFEHNDKVVSTSHIAKVHARLNQSWHYGCKKCGQKFAGLTMYDMHVESKHQGTPLLPNRLINKDWSVNYPVVEVDG